MIIMAPGGPTPGASYAVQLPRPWVSGEVPDRIRAPPAPAGGAAPHRTSRPTPTSPPELVRRPVRRGDVARRTPPRTGRATRGDRFQRPGTPRDGRTGSRGRPFWIQGPGDRPPPGGGRCRDWRCSPRPPRRSPRQHRVVLRGELPGTPGTCPGRPSSTGESRVLEPHVPVHRVSVRPGAAGERAAARAARPVDVRVRRRHGSPHGRTGAGITGKGPELFAAAPAALPVTSRRTPRGVARGAYPDRRRRGVPRPSRTAGAWSPFTTAARTAGRPVHPGSPRQQHRRRYCRTALPGYTTSTRSPRRSPPRLRCPRERQLHVPGPVPRGAPA